MKKLLWLIIVMGWTHVLAGPLYFSFTGKVERIPIDKGGNAEAYNIKVGSPANYIFVVDTALPGYTKSLGTKTEKRDEILEDGAYLADYFLDSLLRPSFFSSAINDLSSGSFFGSRTTRIVGEDHRSVLTFQTTVGDANTATTVSITFPDSGPTLSLPKVGVQVSAQESYTSNGEGATLVLLSMTLTAISNFEPSFGLKAIPIHPKAWIHTRFSQSYISLVNRSGKPARAKILNLAGKPILKYPIGEIGMIPLVTLPHGRYLLQVIAAEGNESFLQAFCF
jgi:hypothetical protein